MWNVLPFQTICKRMLLGGEGAGGSGLFDMVNLEVVSFLISVGPIHFRT